MSKDFKSEYENQLDFEIPDLWSRIEPQLHEKASQATVNMQQPVTVQMVANNQQPYVAVKTKKSKLRRIYAYSGIAVACLCVVIAIPVLMGNMERKDASNDMVAMDSAVSEESVNENTTAGWSDIMIGSADADMDMEMDKDTSAESEVVTDDCVMEDGTAAGSDAAVNNAPLETPEETQTESAVTDEEATMPDADTDEKLENWESETEYSRLPEDTGEVLEIYGTVIAFNAGDGSALYEILVTEVDSDMLSYDTESVILVEWILTEEQLSAPEAEYRLSDEVRLQIQWDEESGNYRILAVL